MTRSTRLATAVLAATITASAALSATPHALAAQGCPDVDAVAVPGTSQTSPDADPATPVGLLSDILEPLKQQEALKITTFYTPYAATIFGGTDSGGYRGSKNSGIDATNAHLAAVSKRCPATVFLLTGYSQGADVAGDVAAAIGHNKGAIPANKLLGVVLVADPSQAPQGQPTIGLTRPGMGFAGVRSSGFGSLTQRNGILTLCHPLDFYCALPQDNLVMRLIGHLGSQLDASDPGGSAQKLATMFMAGLIAPATAAISQILALVNDPNLIPNLISRGVAFAQALAQQLFALAGPQVAAAATDLVNAITQVINLVTSRAWTAIPGVIATIAARAADVGTALSQMQTRTQNINVSGFSDVGNGMAADAINIGNIGTALLNAITVATGGVGTQSTGVFGPTFSQFTAVSVATSLKYFAQFLAGGFHGNYTNTGLDQAGHTGTQIAQRYFVNQLTKLI